jgi:hypothetical protein
MSSKSRAEKSAMKDCQSKGGITCKLDVSYDNSCAALLVGDQGFSVRTGTTLNDAVKNASAACSAFTQNCHTYYSACSLPQRTQ